MKDRCEVGNAGVRNGEELDAAQSVSRVWEVCEVHVSVELKCIQTNERQEGIIIDLI